MEHLECKTVGEVKEKGLYLWRFKPIRFNGLAVPNTPERKGEELDNFDHVFTSETEFKKWHRERVVRLAELDQSMNFCQYFVRGKGNEGNYVREGKSFPVDGSWVGIQDLDSNYAPTQPFVRWLEENGWRKDWFKLHERYTTLP